MDTADERLFTYLVCPALVTIALLIVSVVVRVVLEASWRAVFGWCTPWFWGERLCLDGTAAIAPTVFGGILCACAVEAAFLVLCCKLRLRVFWVCPINGLVQDDDWLTRDLRRCRRFFCCDPFRRLLG